MVDSDEDFTSIYMGFEFLNQQVDVFCHVLALHWDPAVPWHCGPPASQKELQEVEEHVAGGRPWVFMDDFYHMLP